MKRLVILICFIISAQAINAQKTENIILITLDGLRWQELYFGADSLLVDDSGYVEEPEGLVKQYWHNSPVVRRETLMPFLWNTVANYGQV
ncbi:unnamed protein product, partial [Chrysoparadoxa australica]